MIELLSSTTADGKYAVMAREGKAGLHHICLEVEDIDAAPAELRAKGIRLLDETPRVGHCLSLPREHRSGARRAGGGATGTHG